MNSNQRERCDIIIPVWNHLDETKECMESIKRHTHYSYRIIIVDNASDKETKEYLDSLESSNRGHIIVIRNDENKGFVKAVNQGMRFSDAGYVCVMNNDTIATRGWLEELIDILQEDNNIGLINPSSNTSCQFPGKLDIDIFASTLKVFKGRYQELYTCRAFCMVIKREVINRIGYLDEIYGIGYFDDTDYCKRAQEAGYRTARAKASYVYHKESRSFSKVAQKSDIFLKNEKEFISRWGKRLRVAYVVPNVKHQLDTKKTSHAINRILKFGHQIWIFTIPESKRKLAPLIIDHDSIRFFYLPNIFFNFLVIYKIWKRKGKKRLHAVLTNSIYTYKLINFFKKNIDVDIFMDNNFQFIENRLYQISHTI